MSSQLLKFHYAPNSGKVEGAYCFRLVRACVRPSVACPLQNLLRYSFEISYMDSSSKIIDTYFFKVWIIPLCGVMPLLKGHNEIL